MAEAMFKGVALVHLGGYMREHFGSEGFNRLIASLRPELRQRMLTPSAAEWYSFKDHIETLQKVAEIFHAGDASKIAAVGEHNLRCSINGVYKVIVLFLTPEYLIRKSARLWSSLLSAGEFNVEALNPNELHITLAGLPSPHAVWCHSCVGAFVGSMQACGAKNPTCVHDACTLQGAPACTYRVKWS